MPYKKDPTKPKNPNPDRTRPRVNLSRIHKHTRKDKQNRPRYKSWDEYYNAVRGNWYRLNPWGRRILDIRGALGWSQDDFCRVSGFDYKILRTLERGHRRKYYPRLVTIKRVRLVEAAYAEELAQFRSDRTKWWRLNGYRNPNPHGHYTRPGRPKIIYPRDPAYIEALGGMAVFERLKPWRERAASRTLSAPDSGGDKLPRHRTQ